MAHPLSAGLTIKSSSVLRVWIACSSSLDIFATTRTALFSRFQDAFRDIIRQLSNGELDEDGVDSIIFHLEQLSVHLVRLCNVDLMNNQTERLISNTIMLLRSYKNVNRQASSFQSERNLNGKRGRPRFSISSEQLQYLLNYDLSVPDIAQALVVSRSTIFRRMRTFGLSVGQRMTDISDKNLEITIRQVQQDFPNTGYRRVCSQLLIRHQSTANGCEKCKKPFKTA